jgi:hypothetical protein
MNTWSDQDGNLWLCGGKGYAIDYGWLNDVWKYDITTNQWTWMKGGQGSDQPFSFGQLNVPSISNQPQSRYEAMSFADDNGNLYMFGGLSTVDELYNNDLWRYNIATNTWTWINGEDRRYHKAVHGTQGVAADANTPTDLGGFWKGNDGNIWTFGGTSANSLWKYNPATNQWTWMKGDSISNQFGVYGTMGVTAATNKPGARYSFSSWTDASGNLWMFGGNGRLQSPLEGYINELWKYDIATNQWTWMKGQNTENEYGTYGTMGTADPANTPGSREQALTWKDQAGNFWLYGGHGYGGSTIPSGTYTCSDLWKYTVATNQWTWVGGSKSGYVSPVYGTQGIAAAGNSPGWRYNASTWTDQSGNLWLFGGSGFDDLWKYNIASGLWTWVKGNIVQNKLPVHGSLGISAATNTPGERSACGVFYTGSNALYLFGGYNIEPSTVGLWMYNDLWKYDLITNQWTWIKGDSAHNQYAVYGVLGQPSAANKPGTRRVACSWVDDYGNFWMYAGYGSSSDCNGPDGEPLITINPQGRQQKSLFDIWWLGSGAPHPGDVSICPNGGSTITSNKTGTSYQWQQNTGTGFANISNNSNFSGVNTPVLQFNNIPSSWYGYQYRCVVDGNNYSVVFSIATRNTWTGAVSTAWENPANWSCGIVPDANTDVEITVGTVVISSNATIHSLVIDPSVSLTVASGFNFTILN